MGRVAAPLPFCNPARGTHFRNRLRGNGRFECGIGEHLFCHAREKETPCPGGMTDMRFVGDIEGPSREDLFSVLLPPRAGLFLRLGGLQRMCQGNRVSSSGSSGCAGRGQEIREKGEESERKATNRLGKKRTC